MQPRHISLVLFVLGGLTFLLPWVTITCEEEPTTITGWEIVLESRDEESLDETISDDAWDEEDADYGELTTYARVALAAIAGGASVTLLSGVGPLFRRQSGRKLRAALAGLAEVMLLLFWYELQSVPLVKALNVIQLEIGFWACAISVAFAGIYQFMARPR